MNWFQRAKRTLSIDSSPLMAMLRQQKPAVPGRRLAFESLEPRWVLSHVAPGLVDTPQTYSGPLSGKVVFTSPGHGWQWNSTLGRYATDRPEYQLVEDFGTQDQMTLYADYLLRAGATVVPMRPVGRQINQVVLDNDSAGVTFTGAWTDSTGTDYYDEDYGSSADAIPYRFAGTTTGAETSVATYTPNISSAGFYPVYSWVARSANRTTQLYRINHTGGATEIRVDHRQVGYGWVYLGTYHFGSGSSPELGSVQISNNSLVAGQVIADAIRFGNGMGDFTDAGAPGPSGYPREDENSYKWIQRMLGVGTTSTEAIGSGTSNVSAPSNMAQWMYNPNGAAFGNALYVGIHSNGTTGDPATATSRGAVGLIDTDSADRTPHQADLALFLGRQINQDMQALPGVFEHNWSTRTTHTFTSQFGEIDLGGSAEMDATIIEVGFHDNIQDGALLRDPKARDQIARAMLQGTLEYFDVWGGLATPTSLPTAPINVSAVSDSSGQVTINWAAGSSTPASVNGAAPTGYRVYASVDGYGFDGGTLVGTTSATLSGFDPTRPYYFRVTAVNAGGESKPSEVITALPSGGVKQVLIVNGFDRFDRTQDFAYPYAYTGDGLVDRVWARYNNSFDYVVQVQKAIQAAEPGLHVASTSNEAVINGSVNLNDYDAVIWISGEESTVDETFSATEQTKVQQFISAGGHFFVSGSEIGWDLDAQSGGVSFFENTLKANYVSDDAGTYSITVAAGSIFAGMPNFSFSNGSAFSSLDGQVYNVDTPDVISPQAGALSALSYNGGAGGTAAIQVQGTGGSGNIVMLAFPFEAITNVDRREDVMERVLNFFQVSAATPGIDIETFVNGQDADSLTGPVLAAGSTATFSYTLTNTGNVALSSVVVSDNNGTPGNAADDFIPTFTGGDTNGNSQLDVNETWTYSANRTVVAGQYSNVGSVSSLFNALNVSDTDAANYLGSAPGIQMQSFINGVDADSPTGPILAVGELASFTYEVTNTGNTALTITAISDNRGTPGNPADDFAPAYLSGDANSNGLLDLTETWTYRSLRSVTTGQYSSTAVVTASDGIGQEAIGDDTLNYFGSAPSVNIQTLVNGNEADAPSGPSLAVGSTATFTYVVTNTGNIALSAVLVSDNNGTAGTTSDDFNPSFTGGDTNSNGLLDTDETWTYTAMRVVTAGQFTNSGYVEATDVIEQFVDDLDSANHLGVVAQNADFNNDGTVDAADYVLWRKFAGTTVPAGDPGDANNDTQVDEEDYDIYEQQFGTTSPGAGGAAADAAMPPSAEAAGSDSVGQDLGARSLAAAPSATISVSPALRDAAFSQFSTATLKAASFGSGAKRSTRDASVNRDADWPAILAAIADRAGIKDRPETGDSEILGICSVSGSAGEGAGISENESATRIRLPITPKGLAGRAKLR